MTRAEHHCFIPEELFRKMKRHPKRWSEIVRRSLSEYAGKLEVMECGVVSSDELAEVLRKSRLDLSSIGLDESIEHYEVARKHEWKRSSTIKHTHKLSRKRKTSGQRLHHNTKHRRILEGARP